MKNRKERAAEYAKCSTPEECQALSQKFARQALNESAGDLVNAVCAAIDLLNGSDVQHFFFERGNSAELHRVVGMLCKAKRKALIY